MFVQRVSQNIFGLKTIVPDTTSNSLTSITDIATRIARDLTSLSKFATLTDFLPDNVKNLVNLAHSKFLTPFDNRQFNRIGTISERDSIVNGLNEYITTIANDDTLIIFLDCIIRGTNAAFNMKDLEAAFINYKKTAQEEIDNLKEQVALLMGQQPISSGDVTGAGSASFNIELTLYYTIYIYIYGYHPDDEDWITDSRGEIVNDLVSRIESGEITSNDILPELYANT